MAPGGTGLEAHHLIEKRFADNLGMNANDILSIAIDEDTHEMITQLFREKIHYNTVWMKEGIAYTATALPQKIWDTTVEVYKEMGMEEFLTPLKEMLIEKGHDLNWGGW